jgi:hypothetical protein
MPTQGQGTRRRLDPLGAVGEGMAAGSRVVGAVADSMGARGGSSRATVGEDLTDLTAELFDRLGETLRELAGVIAERGPSRGEGALPALALSGVAGETASVPFRFTNTGEAALDEVGFVATALLGAAAAIDASAVHVGWPDGTSLRPRGSIELTLQVEIPDDAPPGSYRGVIAAGMPPRTDRGRARGLAEAGPEDAWALVLVEVGATGAQTPIPPVER